MTTMRAIVIEGTGGSDVLHAADVELPTRVNAEFLVKVVAAGVNPIDVTSRSGAGASAAFSNYPVILGNDFSGIVVESSYDAHPIKPGDEVYARPDDFRIGTFAEYIAVKEQSVARKPFNLSMEEAASIPLVALTAWQVLVDIAKLKKEQKVFIQAGSGGVGTIAIQFATFFGARDITTGATRNADWLHELGASEVIDYSTTRFEDVAHDVDVVIDLIGNATDDTGTRSLGVLKPGGLLVNVPTGSWPTLTEDAAAAGVRATDYRVPADGSTLAVVSRLLESGDVRVFVDQVFDLDRAAEAHVALETGHTRGKIVLKVSDG